MRPTPHLIYWMRSEANKESEKKQQHILKIKAEGFINQKKNKGFNYGLSESIT